MVSSLGEITVHCCSYYNDFLHSFLYKRRGNEESVWAKKKAGQRILLELTKPISCTHLI
jgi:hypothetical protein